MLNLSEIQHHLRFKLVIVEMINNVVGVKNNTSVKEQVYLKVQALVLTAFQAWLRNWWFSSHSYYYFCLI